MTRQCRALACPALTGLKRERRVARQSAQCVAELSVHLIPSLQRLSSNRRKGRTLFPLDLVFARKAKTAHSLLWFAAIKCLERVKDAASLAPQGRFIAAETIEREIGQIG